MRNVYLILSFAAAFGGAMYLRSATPEVRSGSWAPSGVMSQARTGAAAVRLADGRVLMTGGTGINGALASAELFGPTGSFSQVASMIHSRSQHVSVALDDGRILVAGGKTQGDAVFSSAELYDPRTNTWADAGVMNASRIGHTATLLPDGRVLIAGGQGEDVTYPSLEIFDSVSNRFETLSVQLSSPRTRHAATLLPDGRVLLAGGFSGAQILQTTDIFDPQEGTLSRGPDLLAPREGSSATRLLDGRVLIAGGSNGSADLASAEILDATTMKLTATGAMTTARRGHLAFLLPNNNRVLLVGGDAAGNSAELFTPWRGSFRSTGNLDETRAEAAGAPVGLDGALILAGGRNRSLQLDSSKLYRFATLKTDKDEYNPGEPVSITGSGWQPGEKVTLTVQAIRKNSQDRTLTLTADPVGNVATQFDQESQDPGKTYYVTANASSSDAQLRFATNPAAKLFQCQDGPYLTQAQQKTATCAWVNGNVNGAKATYFEGDSLPYQVIMTNLPKGSHSLAIQWATSQSGKHALDYLTSYNRTIANPDPCTGTGADCSTVSTVSIPTDTYMVQHMVSGGTQVPGSFSLWGGALSAPSGYTPSAPDYTGTTANNVTINFTTSTANATVVLAWAAHIASRHDWGEGNSAISISGSPFHTGLVSLDGANIGTQSAALATDAVIFPASITIVKQASPANASVFPFTASPSPLSNFNLTVDGSTTANTTTFAQILPPAGGSFPLTFTIKENTATDNPSLPAGWQLSGFQCSTGVGGLNKSSFTYSGTTATITLGEGDPVTCTYTNAPKTHAVTLTKSLASGDPGKFNLTVNNATKADQINGGSVSDPSVPVFSLVTVKETAGTGTDLSNYTPSLSCPGVSPATTGTNPPTYTFTMPDSDINCTLTNSRGTTTVKVLKSLSPTTDKGTFDLSINGAVVRTAAANGDSGVTNVNVGDPVTVSESSNSNYTSTLTCDTITSGSLTTNPAGTSGSFNVPSLAAGKTITCTFLNTRKAHTVTLKKTVLPSGDGGKFDLTVNSGAPVNVGDGEQTSASNVAVGSTVSVGESGASLANYSSTLSCPGTDLAVGSATSGTFTMPDTDVTCTLTNTRKTHTVTLKKTVLPSGDGGTFDLTVNSGAPVNVGDGGKASASNVAVGSKVSLGESGASLVNYMSALSCPGTDLAVGSTTSGTFTMPDTDVTCTLTNTRKTHTVTLKKTVLPSGDGGTFDLTVNSGAPVNVGDGGKASASNVAVGSTVSVGESGANLVNYTSALSCPSTDLAGGSTTSGAFTMPDGDVTCTLTNTRKTHKVTLTKTVLPSGDPTTFSLTANTVTGPAGDGQSVIDPNSYVGSSVTVSEDTNNTDFTAGSISCSTAGGPLATGASPLKFTMPDADVSCGVTNTKYATLVIAKTCAANETGTPTPFTINDGGNFLTTLTCGTAKQFTHLSLGVHNLTEASPSGIWNNGNPSGWTTPTPGTFTGAECVVDGVNGKVNLVAGHTTYCFVLNVANYCTPVFPPPVASLPTPLKGDIASAPIYSVGNPGSKSTAGSVPNSVRTAPTVTRPVSPVNPVPNRQRGTRR